MQYWPTLSLASAGNVTICSDMVIVIIIVLSRVKSSLGYRLGCGQAWQEAAET
jgi:hypothetical protein